MSKQDLNQENNNNNVSGSHLSSTGNPFQGFNEMLETSSERKKRKYSLWIMYFTTFLQSIGGSIVITGLWPYLQQLDESTSKEWFGWVVAANPLGQLISSPLIGWVCNRQEATRGPSIFCLFVFILANCWYAILPLHVDGAKWFILVARFLVGISSGSITACRTFVTQGTLVAERTASISHLSLSQALGFVLGPVGQLALQPLGKDGFVIAGLPVNMYTAVGWLTATLGLINLIFFHPNFFHESDIAIREAQGKRKISEKDGKVSVTYNMDNSKLAAFKTDYTGIMVIVFNFFIVFFEFVLLETLATIVSMDQFGWSAGKAITVVGLAMVVSSIVSTSIFFLIPILAKYFDERVLLIGFGLVPYTLGRIFFFPFFGEAAPSRQHECYDPSGAGLNVTTEEICKLVPGNKWSIVAQGCPQSQSWCSEMPALQPFMVAIGYAICTLGFPFCIAMSQTIFSKMLGPKPQGVWMGGLTSISSLARVIGPIFVTNIYAWYGTIVTSTIALGLMLVVILALIIVYKRLVPSVRI